MPIIVPSSRLAVPSRPVIRPGWDDLPVDRPRRRSAWWRRLLSGAAGLTRLQPGACCGCPPTTCDGCDMTATSATISWTGSGNTAFCCTCVSGGSATFTPWVAPPPCQNVVNPCSTCGGGAWAVSLLCSGGHISLQINAACPGGGGNSCTLTASSIQCSPLLLTFTATSTGGCNQCFASFTVSA